MTFSAASGDDKTLTSFKDILASIDEAIVRLRSLSQLDVQPAWQWHHGDLPIEIAVEPNTWKDWAIAPLNARHHIAWNKGKAVLWLGQQIHVPQSLHGFPLRGMTLRLALTWWAEDAQIFVNETPVHTGDLFDCFGRILLSPSVVPGDVIHVAIRLVSPGHDNGALVRSLCLYENRDQQIAPLPEPGFIADEMAIIKHYFTTFAPENIKLLHDALQQIHWQAMENSSSEYIDPHIDFKDSLAALRTTLLPFRNWLKQRHINLLGHAHLDLAWLWPIADTWNAAQRTFESVLSLQEEFHDLTFTHSTPALYEWIEDHRPDLFQAIQKQVIKGDWEIGAGLWVEPELNIISGESIIRQVLYGQRYAREQFGQVSRIAWLPDSFGFCWQLPQILTQGKVDYFATQKLRWNDTNPFPFDVFDWCSPDGTTIHSVTLPPIGSDMDPVKMASYACQWEANTGCLESLWLPGIGDHGGGPTRDMLMVAQRWQQSPFFPTIQFSTAEPFLDRIFLPSSSSPVLSSALTHSPNPVPVWNDELYLELHRGCYTTHAEQKRWNRRCETLLYQVELFSSIATLLTGSDYPKQTIELTWKQILFNQFHDILPGTSIPEVYEEVNPIWEKAEKTTEAILKDALMAIANHIQLPPHPVISQNHPPDLVYPFVLFNGLNWERSELAQVSLPHEAEAGKVWAVFDHHGKQQPTQCIGSKTITLQASSVPGVGYQLFWLTQRSIVSSQADIQLPQTKMAQRTPGNSDFEQVNQTVESDVPDQKEPTKGKEWILENDDISVVVNPNTGEIDRFYDKAHQQDVLNGAGNQLQFFQDSGQYWDAWNIDPDYDSHPLSEAILVDIAWKEQGLLQQRLRVIKRFGRSRIQQDYVLQAGSPILRVETDVDWYEDFTLLKVAFPLALETTTATYEIPCGAIERAVLPSHQQSPTPLTSQEQAKWEVPALNWVDLSNGNYGVSIFSDYKHGYDATSSRIRLTLLKSPKWPDPEADRGHHQFTYGIYPHSGRWTQAETLQRGYAFNQPLIHIPVNSQLTNPAATLPAIAQIINLPNENIVLTAFKQAEDSSDGYILRFYEGYGKSTRVRLLDLFPMLSGSDRRVKYVGRTNLLEDLPEDLPEENFENETANDIYDGTSVAIAPWQIVNLCFQGRSNFLTAD